MRSAGSGCRISVGFAQRRSVSERTTRPAVLRGPHQSGRARRIHARPWARVFDRPDEAADLGSAPRASGFDRMPPWPRRAGSGILRLPTYPPRRARVRRHGGAPRPARPGSRAGPSRSSPSSPTLSSSPGVIPELAVTGSVSVGGHGLTPQVRGPRPGPGGPGLTTGVDHPPLFDDLDGNAPFGGVRIPSIGSMPHRRKRARPGPSAPWGPTAASSPRASDGADGPGHPARARPGCRHRPTAGR